MTKRETSPDPMINDNNSFSHRLNNHFSYMYFMNHVLCSSQGKTRQQKIDRDGNRDISEKIALGMLKGTAQLSGEALYDSRLFNQSAGMDSGFGADDEYTAYSKPLFERGEASAIYRPKRDDVDVYGDADAQVTARSCSWWGRSVWRRRCF